MHLLEIVFFLVSHRLEVIQKGPEVKRADTVSQWINRYPVDKCQQTVLWFPPKRDYFLSQLCYPPIQKPEPNRSKENLLDKPF